MSSGFIHCLFNKADSSGYCDWPQSNAEKRGAVKDKLFPAFISRRSLQCSPCYDKQYSLSFLTCSAARRDAARRPVGPYLETNEMGVTSWPIRVWARLSIRPVDMTMICVRNTNMIFCELLKSRNKYYNTNVMFCNRVIRYYNNHWYMYYIIRRITIKPVGLKWLNTV